MNEKNCINVASTIYLLQNIIKHISCSDEVLCDVIFMHMGRILLSKS